MGLASPSSFPLDPANKGTDHEETTKRVTNSNLTSPPIAKARDPLPSQAIELEDRSRGAHQYNRAYSDAITSAGSQTPYEARTQPQTEVQTPKAFKTPNELESSRPPSPRANGFTAVVPGWSYPAMNRYRVLAACAVYFANGLNDSAAGALIPYMETDYHIGYAVVSLIFITNAVGFIAAAFMTEAILSRVGRARACMISEAVLITGYVIITCKPPFPAVVFAFLLLGLGMALNLALNNGFCANLANSTVILGAAHGSYGVGGIVGPIAATALVSRGVVWSRFYTIALALRVINLFFTGWAFRKYEQEPTSILSSSLDRLANRQRATELGEPSKMQMLKRAVNNRTTIIGALFIFAYQGAEVSISAWAISYLIKVRGGDPAKVGYVTAGFWGRITLERFVLSHAARRVGEKRFVYILTTGSVAFQLLVWFIPNIIGEAVAVSILGLLLGPVYPCAQTIFTALLPMQIQMTSISFISSAGSSGGAVAPFMTGMLAQAAGTFVLHPICVALFAVMMGCWFGLPKVVKRTE